EPIEGPGVGSPVKWRLEKAPATSLNGDWIITEAAQYSTVTRATEKERYEPGSEDDDDTFGDDEVDVKDLYQPIRRLTARPWLQCVTYPHPHKRHSHGDND